MEGRTVVKGGGAGASSLGGHHIAGLLLLTAAPVLQNGEDLECPNCHCFSACQNAPSLDLLRLSI